ncbi:AAA family ATPase [Pacificibacter marinus]|uniref:AAA family ATPase n=1 Tax=Pacificibacter marinus TaxID=658057 RepID=UPI001C06AB1F|nr:AAA family ATPase [Pacificibacter marinus]MBU2865992.1 AAA family ATPase [Pacificibacter marinus]
MQTQTRHETDWRQAVYDALARYCAIANTPEETTTTESSSASGAAQAEFSDADFRAFAEEELPLTQVAALCLVAKACAQNGNIERIWQQGATVILHTAIESSRISWALKRLLPDRFEFGWDYRSEAQPMFRMVRTASVDPRGPTYDYSIVDALTRNDDPMIFLAPSLDDLHPAVAMFDANLLCIDGIDRDVLPVLFALRYPALTDEQINLLVTQVPDLRGVSLADLDCVILVFRNNDHRAIPTMIARFLKESVDAEGSAKSQSWQPRSIVPLADLVGLGAAKLAAQDAVTSLRDWKAGTLPWSAVPRGLLLSGPAGTGKTELARSLAGEAGIQLVTASYSHWQKAGSLSHFLAAMDRSFKDAMRQAPTVLFIDEIDAFYTRTDFRGDGRNDSYDVKAIAGLLEKLDGISDREGVIVVGACNHLKFVDPAIRRAGRFDVVAEIGLPTLEELGVILGQHLGERSLGIDLTVCAATALGRTGADCAAAVRTAGATARRESRALTTDDVIAALEGDAPKLSDEEWFRLAVHECGHALVATALNVGAVEYARIGSSGGECKIINTGVLQTENDLHISRCVALAGREAERLVFGSIIAGSGGEVDSDIAKATRTASDQICSFGMGSLGPIWLASAGSQTSVREAVSSHLPEVAELLHAAELDARNVLIAHRDLLVEMAMRLSEKKVLHGDTLEGYLSQIASSDGVV